MKHLFFTKQAQGLIKHIYIKLTNTASIVNFILKGHIILLRKNVNANINFINNVKMLTFNHIYRVFYYATEVPLPRVTSNLLSIFRFNIKHCISFFSDHNFPPIISLIEIKNLALKRRTVN